MSIKIMYNEINFQGDMIVLEEKETSPGRIKFVLGDRFNIFITSYDANIFDFFRNYVCMIEKKDIVKAWEAYKKAKTQRSDDTIHAFWMYFEGKKIVPIGKGVFEWV